MVLLLDLTVNYAACLDLCCSINPNKQHAACLDLDCVFYAVRNMSCKVMNVKHLLYIHSNPQLRSVCTMTQEVELSIYLREVTISIDVS